MGDLKSTPEPSLEKELNLSSNPKEFLDGCKDEAEALLKDFKVALGPRGSGLTLSGCILNPRIRALMNDFYTKAGIVENLDFNADCLDSIYKGTPDFMGIYAKYRLADRSWSDINFNSSELFNKWVEEATNPTNSVTKEAIINESIKKVHSNLTNSGRWTQFTSKYDTQIAEQKSVSMAPFKNRAKGLRKLIESKEGEAKASSASTELSDAWDDANTALQELEGMLD